VTNHAVPPASAADIPVAWTGQDNDGGSGLAFFDIFVSVNRGPFQVWLPQTTLRSAVYTGVQGNTYSFYSVGTDRAGNREAAPAAPDAETSVTLSNQPPSIAALTEDSLDEGATASFTLAFTDPNLPNDRLNLRAIGAPTGLSLDATSGLIRWPTSEATGPSTNRFQVIVTDNGMPPLSATGEVVIVVREVNQPPSLWPIANRVVREMSLLLITNRASDADLPANILTFSLGAGAPTGASIDPVTGLFQWRPSELQGPSTNRIAVIVTDNGVPPLSATQTFIVVVRDTEPAFVLNLGTTNVFAGETNALPVILKSGLDLNRVTFEMTVPEERLTNWTLMLVAPEAVSGSGQRLGSGRFRIEILLNPEQAVSGSRTIAFLGFTAVPHARSIIVPVIPTSLAGYQATGPSLTNGAAWGGRVFVVATEPVLDLARTSNGFVNLFLYGTPGTTNRIQSTPSLEMPVWFVEWSNVLQGRMIAIPLAPTNSPARFFRAGSP